ncbi:hypothetical protein MP638_004773 [Amoeboaphelidium occidentale]|nr:hypothetical protein MP638_004773 [Amoeboaphelidium occidentale]
MKPNLLRPVWILLLVFFVYAAPVDEPVKRISNHIEEEYQKESTRDQLFQRPRNVQRSGRQHGSVTGAVDETVPSPLLGLPSDIWQNSIFPLVAAGHAENLRLANKEFNQKVNSTLKDFPPVAKACGKRAANLLIEQQWPSEYYQPAWFEINDEAKAKSVHECLWATRKWVETLDAPRTIKIKVLLPKANETADFLSDKHLFEITKNVRFSIKLHVTRYRGSMDKVLKALSTNECIQTLDFTGNRMGDDLIIKLAATLRSNTALQSLELWGNAISPEGAKALAEALIKNTALLQLSLGSNDIGDEGAEAFAEALKINAKLQHLDLSHNKISHQGAKYLAEAMKVHAAVQYLNLRGNKLRNEGAIYLAGALNYLSLHDLKHVQKISGGEIIKAFLENLKIGTGALHLHLGLNEIGDDGAIALGEALKNNTRVQTLDLAFNDIAALGVKALADGLKTSVLRKLELESNNASYEGTAALAEVLKTNTALKYLTLQQNELDIEAAEILVSSLETNCGIQILDLRQNNFNKEMVKKIRAFAKIKGIRILL